MPNIVVLGSCKHEPYTVTVPKKHPTLHNTEEGYQLACSWIYPAIDNSDVVIVWLPDSEPGEHTGRDMEYALKQGKRVIVITPTMVIEKAKLK